MIGLLVLVLIGWFVQDAISAGTDAGSMPLRHSSGIDVVSTLAQPTYLTL